jgi:AcrR family transcriptional regulator
MSEVTFIRARNADQRAARRATILSSAADMLRTGVRVADLSLNDLARRVGLAKSNVLHYFETREAVLLELLDAEYTAWLDDVEAATHAFEPDSGTSRVDAVADVLSRTVAHRPILSELLASSALVLEHNVSAEVAADYKRRAIAQATRLASLLELVIGPLPTPSRLAAAGATNIIVGGVWGLCRPPPGMLAAYQRYPELEAMRVDYRVAVRELIATMLTGLLHRPIREE